METNLFIKNYKAEGNKIKDLKLYGDMEIDIGGGGSDKYYHYATGEVLCDRLDGFITPIVVGAEKCLLLQAPTDSYLHILGEDLFLYSSAIHVSSNSAYVISTKPEIDYSRLVITIFSKNAFYKCYSLTKAFVESLF